MNSGPDHPPRGHSYSQILKGVVTAIAGRSVGVISSFIAIPLTVRYLGPERYGAWVTLTSILSWVTVFDLGVGSIATNRVADALAKDHRAEAGLRVYDAYYAVIIVSFVIGCLVLIAWPFISWPALLGARTRSYNTEITGAAACAFAVFLLYFPTSVTPRILGACHKVAESNYWNSAGSILGLFFLALATQLKGGLPELVLSFSGATLLTGILSTGWLFRRFDWMRPIPRHIPFSRVKELLSSGLPFFAVQLSGVLLLQTDNIIIAQVLGAGAVTPYSVTWRFFSYASLLQVMAIPALWPAYADAFARQDYPWIRKTYRYNLRIAVATAFVCVLGLLLIARWFIAIWAGPSAVPTRGLTLGMAAWSLLSVVSWCESCILGAAGRVKGQAIYSGIGAVVNILVSIWLCRRYGLVGIILGTLCAYTICIIVPQTLEVRRTLIGDDPRR